MPKKLRGIIAPKVKSDLFQVFFSSDWKELTVTGENREAVFLIRKKYQNI